MTQAERDFLDMIFEEIDPHLLMEYFMEKLNNYRYEKHHKPYYDKFYIDHKEGEPFTNTLIRSDLTVDELENLHNELNKILKEKERIRSNLGDEMSEPLRRIRASAHSAPEIGLINGQIKKIRTKTQYKNLDKAIVQAINIKKETKR